ncbi:polyamine aminopropyltransferase [Labrys sp. KNU-23]|uniref:polyamine aminopropyltransferase n=1 Tax=Labrys sp. KNU-23 TaxID=2789216 RepID=UPI0011EBEEC4|nr:polyamine aminopropyltransferase [Labrys sp. KNU-23]QEN89881.1 polyamine aminopropyltransferase [Labrys sp. KNU-23]
MEILLLFSAFVIATCGLIYELIAGTLASYLLGDSVTQFSTIIGTYLFAMGVGSWLSRYLERDLLGHFVRIELLVGAVGGSSAAALFILFDHVASFRLWLYSLVGVIGILVGIEIPLLLRILEGRLAFKDLVSKVFTFDYIGALFASLLFPLVLVPYLGLIRSAFLFGILNTLVAIWVLYAIKAPILRRGAHKASAFAVLAALGAGFVWSERIQSIAEASAYPGTVVYAESTPYQRIVVTRQQRDIRLFLNSNLQFSSLDEYRYHEALVHPVMSALKAPRRVLIIGGGDGLALREVLKYPAVEAVTMVDLDPAVTHLFSHNEMMTGLNGGSLSSPKLTLINADAFLWLREQKPAEMRFDAVIIDLPDPSNFSIGKLYSLTFYRLLKSAVNQDGLVVIQSTSPLVARKSFWCVNNTLAAAGFQTAAYHLFVPSFGEWGFIIGSFSPYRPPDRLPEGLRFLDVTTMKAMFQFPPDMAHVATAIQRLDDQPLVRYFDEEWGNYLIY